MENKVEIFLQGLGIPRPTLIKISAQCNVRDIIDVAKDKGLKIENGEAPQVWLEDQDEPLPFDLSLKEAGIKRRGRVHVHTCPRIHVVVNFQSRSEQHPFSPSTTIHTVKRWADKKFGLSEVDASEYALQVCGSTDRPSDDIQIGSLVQLGQCRVCFDLVSKERVEG
ncbi:MAG: hypothetical protein AB2L16_09500 [Anaerolineaceae bacterium]